MKKITLLFMFVLSAISFAQNNANATALTAAEIVEPLTISKSQDLNFGRIIGGSAGGGTVSIAASEAATRTIPDALNAPSGTITAAKFDITASKYSYTIGLEDTELNGTDLTEMLFTPKHSLGLVNSSTGNLTLYVGGDLTVGATQEAGVYSGTVKVTVQYE
jgi:spore coat protein U-like protein